MFKKFIMSILIVLVFATTSGAMVLPFLLTDSCVSDEVIVKINESSKFSVSASSLIYNKQMQSLGINDYTYYVVKTGGQTVLSSMIEISKNPSVEYVQPNYIYH